jgi:hypothetical protein
MARNFPHHFHIIPSLFLIFLPFLGTWYNKFCNNFVPSNFCTSLVFTDINSAQFDHYLLNHSYNLTDHGKALWELGVKMDHPQQAKFLDCYYYFHKSSLIFLIEIYLNLFTAWYLRFLLVYSELIKHFHVQN